jgi:hypothetical protein
MMRALEEAFPHGVIFTTDDDRRRRCRLQEVPLARRYSNWRRRDPVLDAFLREGKSEDAFVKNIENVQGDERA